MFCFILFIISVLIHLAHVRLLIGRLEAETPLRIGRLRLTPHVRHLALQLTQLMPVLTLQLTQLLTVLLTVLPHLLTVRQVSALDGGAGVHLEGLRRRPRRRLPALQLIIAHLQSNQTWQE
jgi:putative exporter of polyketide antibiotics